MKYQSVPQAVSMNFRNLKIKRKTLILICFLNETIIILHVDSPIGQFLTITVVRAVIYVKSKYYA